MRILLVSEDLPGAQVGGLGKHVVTLGNALIARGHMVRILGRNDCGPDAGPAQIGFRGPVDPGFDYAHPGWKERQLGIFNPLKRPYFARKIGAAINRHAGRFDAVHYHGHLPAVGLYVDRGLNFVQTRHDQGSECLVHLRFRDDDVCTARAARDCSACIAAGAGALRRSVTALAVDGYRQASARVFAMRKTVFVSDFLRRQFLRAVPGADLARCRVIPNFVDYAALRQAAEAAPAAGAGAVGLVGRVDAGKGFAEFLAAAHGRLPAHARVTIAGDGPERGRLEARYAAPAVCFLGWQDYPSALALAARSHVCVVPSVCEEACSTTVLEALALGRPCLALARGGTPELASYQQYPGQLQLAANMPELVERLRLILATAPRRRAPAPQFGADAAVIVSRLVDLYAE
ncbi:glycosyltransferase family 4 protein [Massilia jejuensis]|uniref:Glycosyltransferase family 4 protein n=1 Tax=Massilia jejuensis TaxID=648894 RepID=A0ABW0PHV6_9BURK